MKIKMRQSIRGSVDGITVLTYEAGESYDLTYSSRAAELAKVFTDNGWAEAEVAEAFGPFQTSGQTFAEWKAEVEAHSAATFGTAAETFGVLMDADMLVSGSITGQKLTTLATAAPEAETPPAPAAVAPVAAPKRIRKPRAHTSEI